MKHLIICFLVLASLRVDAQVLSQWRGENRDGIYHESGLLKEWPDNGPDRLWMADSLGKGHSSVAIGTRYLYTTGRIDETEYLTALSFEGEKIWQVAYGRAWNKSYPDVRTTPVVTEDKLWMISGMGEVVCIDALTGEIIWHQNAFEDHGGVCNLYGISESPLLVDGKVFYTTGGFETTMIALDQNTGELVWKSDPIPDSAAYVSPFYAVHNEQKMIINLLADHAVGIDPENGKTLWTFNYIGLESRQFNQSMKRSNCNTPLYHEGKVLLNKGYDHPSALIRLDGQNHEVVLEWTSFDFDTHVGGYVLLDGYLYGSNWINNGNGNWVCAKWETGETMWEETWNNKGSIIYADGLLYIYEEKRGNLALVRPDPTKMDIISSFRITEGSGPHWSHPVIREGILYVRHGDVLLAYDISED